MRRLVYSVAMSLDGYIAGPNGEIDWLFMDPEIDFGAMMSRFDTLLMGRGTFEAGEAMGGGGMTPGVKSIVVSTTMKQEYYPELTIISQDVAGEVARLKEAPGKDIWLFGGGVLFRSLLDVGLVDIVEVGVIPVLLGGGLPLLPEGAKRANLKLASSRVYAKTGTLMLEYRVLKP